MSQRAVAIALIAAGIAVGIIGVFAGIDRGDASPARLGPESPVPTAVAGVGVAPSSEIAWVPYDDAFALAAREHKTVVMVLTATWCGHCRTYAEHVLTDRAVIAMSSRFVMVRVDIDERGDLNARYNVDGRYVPRTMFFTSEGTHRPDLRATARSQYQYFLDTTTPTELLTLMQRALGA